MQNDNDYTQSRLDEVSKYRQLESLCNQLRDACIIANTSMDALGVNAPYTRKLLQTAIRAYEEYQR